MAGKFDVLTTGKLQVPFVPEDVPFVPRKFADLPDGVYAVKVDAFGTYTKEDGKESYCIQLQLIEAGHEGELTRTYVGKDMSKAITRSQFMSFMLSMGIPRDSLKKAAAIDYAKLAGKACYINVRNPAAPAGEGQRVFADISYITKDEYLAGKKQKPIAKASNGNGKPASTSAVEVEQPPADDGVAELDL